MAIVGERLATPESGWKRYGSRYSSFKYNGFSMYADSNKYEGQSMISPSVGGTISYLFYGTKLRHIHSVGNGAGVLEISIDGVKETIDLYSSSVVNTVLVYEKTNLELRTHEVIVTHKTKGSWGSDVHFEAIDIDSTGRLLHPDEVTDVKDLQVGKRIRFKYVATPNTFGMISELGKETSAFIPASSSAAPNGDAYFIMVDTDRLGRKVLIADRNIQHSISWNILNTAGVAAGSGLPIQIDSLTDYEFVVRLLTGGVSSSDKDNEWDKYIVNSTLNGTITAGNNTVWNWNVPIYSWTSTTGSTTSSRVVRGYNSNSTWSQQEITTTTNVGFRPVILIKQLATNKSFILFDGGYKKWGNGWQTVSTTLPTKDTFMNEGIDLSALDRKETLFIQTMVNNGALGSGKVFSTTIDLKKFLDIVKLEIK